MQRARFFDTSKLRPTFIVLNVDALMPAGPPHVDIPTFRGTTRDHYPLRFLKAKGSSGLFERWRVIQACAVAWFYDGPGGDFEYWPRLYLSELRCAKAGRSRLR